MARPWTSPTLAPQCQAPRPPQLRMHATTAGGDGHGQPVLPLKQYEVALQNAQHVLSCLLDQPARPWLCFKEVVQSLSRQASQLQRRAAACRLQRAFRRRKAAKAEKLAQAAAADAPFPWRRRPAPPPLSPQPLASQQPPHLPQPPQTPTLCVPAGGALNPVEKRRQIIASQLAATNPSRLARCRRAPQAAARAGSQPASRDSASPRPPSASRPPPSPRRSLDQVLNQRALIVAQLGASPGRATPPGDRRETPSPRPHASAPAAGHTPPSVGRRTPPSEPPMRSDLLLKDALPEDDPLGPGALLPDGLGAPAAPPGFSAGLSLAPPPSAPRRPNSAGESRPRGFSPRPQVVV